MAKEKIVSIEDRIPKLKQARKKKANRRLVFYLTIFFFLISIIVYIQSPLSHVKTINVTGNSFYQKEEIIAKSGIDKNTNIWMVDKEAITKKLEESPLVNSVTVKTKLPWTVDIQVVEHKRIGYIEQENKYYPILGNGAVLKDNEYNQQKGDAPILENFTDEKILTEMCKELSKLPTGILNLISEVEWTPSEKNNKELTLFMTDGFTVESTIRGFSEKMTVYPSIAAQLDPSIQGIIHIGVGAYFEPFKLEKTEEEIANEGTE